MNNSDKVELRIALSRRFSEKRPFERSRSHRNAPAAQWQSPVFGRDLAEGRKKSDLWRGRLFHFLANLL